MLNVRVFQRVVAGFLLVVLLCAASPVFAQYGMAIADGAVAINETATFSVVLDSSPGPLQGWSFGVCPDNNNLLLEDVFDGADLAALNNGMGPDVATFCTDGRSWAVSVTLSASGQLGLPAAPDLEIYDASYQGAVLGNTILDFCTGPCAPNALIFVVDTAGNGITPTTIPTPLQLDGALVEINDGVPLFIRGDVDDDGVFVTLIDGLFLLRYGFIAGSPEPPCLSSADFDDDGMITPLVDAVALLNFGFGTGTPPAAPFPDCGVDPTIDNLGCTETACP